MFNGILSFPHVDHERLRGPAVWSLIAVVTLCFLLPHEPRRTLFLGWPLLFNLPLFLLFFSDDMRHIAPVTAALLVTAVPPLLEAAFYRSLLATPAARPRRRPGLRGRLVSRTLGRRALLARDAWRYWTPFLDPAPFAWYLR